VVKKASTIGVPVGAPLRTLVESMPRIMIQTQVQVQTQIATTIRTIVLTRYSSTQSFHERPNGKQRWIITTLLWHEQKRFQSAGPKKKWKTMISRAIVIWRALKLMVLSQVTLKRAVLQEVVRLKAPYTVSGCKLRG
jgi:hypothetical protein